MMQERGGEKEVVEAFPNWLLGGLRNAGRGNGAYKCDKIVDHVLF